MDVATLKNPQLYSPSSLSMNMLCLFQLQQDVATLARSKSLHNVLYGHNQSEAETKDEEQQPPSDVVSETIIIIIGKGSRERDRAIERDKLHQNG